MKKYEVIEIQFLWFKIKVAAPSWKGIIIVALVLLFLLVMYA